MREAARSDNPTLDALLKRALELHPQTMDLSLGRIERLLHKLGNPETHLPPVFHVAGTNGKGSTVAFLRACLEAAGERVHCYTSPHLVRFNERIRLGGALIEDALLIELLRDVLSVNAGDPVTFFELTTAIAFVAFAREPAGACLVEVGLGGRLDATNVLRDAAVCGVAQLALDHQAWLGNNILDIAAEKAAIAKRGVPMVLSRYSKTVTARMAEVAGLAGARLFLRGVDWDAGLYGERMQYRDRFGRLQLPLPRLPGAHQVDNSALAVAMLRHQNAVALPESALRAGLGWAEWPARLQRLDSGPLLDLLPAASELWVDGAHNPAAARAIADAFRGQSLAERPFYMVLGMLESKDAPAFLRSFSGRTTGLFTVPIDDHRCYRPQLLAQLANDLGLAAQASTGVEKALATIARGADRHRPPVVLITGSLYLAGQVLAANGPLPH